MDKLSSAQERYLKENIHHKRTVTFYRIFILVSFIGIWEASTRVGLIDSFIFSSPYRILVCFVGMLKDGSIFIHVGVTVLETFVSFFLVTVIGIAVAVILWLSKSISEILEPYLVVLNSLPKSALAPVLIVWLGNNSKTIIVAAVSVAVFGTIINIYNGFKEVSPDKIKLIYTLGGNKKDILTKVVIPSTVPVIISTMKVNIGLSLVGVIIGEFLAGTKGLGYLIIYGSQVFKLDWVMMSIIILCFLAGILYKVIHIIEVKYANNYIGKSST